MKGRVRGSLTVIALVFLLLISGILSYQISIYHSKIAVNRSLIQDYRARIVHRSR